MRNQLKTLLLLGVLSAAVVGVGSLFGKAGALIFAGLAVAMNVGAYFFSDRIVLRMHGAREVSPEEAPRLHAVVEELAIRAGIPKPRVAVIPADYPNAFATGRSPEKGVVAVTVGILALLTPRELRGVLAHELAHIKNRDILVSTVAAGLAAVVTGIANATQWMGLLGGASEDEEGGPSLLGQLALAIVAPIAVSLVQLGISRSREYLADETGAEISGDPEALASALEKMHATGRAGAGEAEPATASLFIVNPLSGSGWTSLFSTHPPVERRVALLRSLLPGRFRDRRAA